MSTYITSEDDVSIEHPNYGVLFAFGGVQWFDEKGFQIVSCLDEDEWCLREASRIVSGKSSRLRIYVRHSDGGYYPLDCLFDLNQGTGDPEWDAEARGWVRDLIGALAA